MNNFLVLIKDIIISHDITCSWYEVNRLSEWGFSITWMMPQHLVPDAKWACWHLPNLSCRSNISSLLFPPSPTHVQYLWTVGSLYYFSKVLLATSPVNRIAISLNKKLRLHLSWNNPEVHRDLWRGTFKFCLKCIQTRCKVINSETETTWWQIVKQRIQGPWSTSMKLSITMIEPLAVSATKRFDPTLPFHRQEWRRVDGLYARTHLHSPRAHIWAKLSCLQMESARLWTILALHARPCHRGYQFDCLRSTTVLKGSKGSQRSAEVQQTRSYWPSCEQNRLSLAQTVQMQCWNSSDTVTSFGKVLART